MNESRNQIKKADAPAEVRELPAYAVIYADGTNYVTSMSRTTDLDAARKYFLDASIEQPDGSCKRVADVKPANETAAIMWESSKAAKHQSKKGSAAPEAVRVSNRPSRVRMGQNQDWVAWMEVLSQNEMDQIATVTGFVTASGDFNMSKSEEFETACNNARSRTMSSPKHTELKASRSQNVREAELVAYIRDALQCSEKAARYELIREPAWARKMEVPKHSKHDERCPNCGRFVEHDADGFYDRLQRDNECSEVHLFCNEDCANQFHQKKV